MVRIKIWKVNKPASDSELLANTLLHQSEVYNLCMYFMNLLLFQVSNHDLTKLDDDKRRILYDFLHKKENGWVDLHTSIERHHIFDNVVKDVNLVDVIECICDWISASFRYDDPDIEDFLVSKYDLNLVKNVLLMAFINTFNMLKRVCETKDVPDPYI